MKCGAEYLSVLMECPAKAAYRVSEKPSNVSELQLYCNAVRNAIEDYAGGTPVKKAWSKAVKAGGFKKYMSNAASIALTGRGIMVLTHFADKFKPLLYQYIKVERDMVNGSVWYDIPIVDDGMNILLQDDISRYAIDSHIFSPVRTLLRLLGKEYRIFSLYTGTLSRPRKEKPLKADESRLTGLLEAVLNGISYPIPGPQCEYCQWKDKCAKEFQEAL